jgi:hypothetical protein
MKAGQDVVYPTDAQIFRAPNTYAEACAIAKAIWRHAISKGATTALESEK